MMLFPWAAGGNLKTVWGEHPKSLIASHPLGWTDFTRWIATQCHGLVDDLRVIHGFIDDLNSRGTDKSLYGIHGDIKPANILHFSQETKHHPLGTLKVADFGMLRFHRFESRSDRSEWRSGAAYQTYRSPEHEISFVVSRKVDIWALGCVCSELLTWVIRGPAGVREFQQERRKEHSHSGDYTGAPWVEEHFCVRHYEQRAMSRLFGHFVKANEPIPKLKTSVLKVSNPVTGEWTSSAPVFATLESDTKPLIVDRWPHSRGKLSSAGNLRRALPGVHKRKDAASCEGGTRRMRRGDKVLSGLPDQREGQ